MGWARDNGIKALCFDIDGTFYPKWQTNVYLIESALTHPVFSMKYNMMRQRMRRLDGYEAGPLMDLEAFRARECELMGWSGTVASYIEKYERVLSSSWDRTMRAHLRLFPGVREALSLARRQGYRLAALSDFPISHKLEVLGLDRSLFDFVASTEDYGHLKPNARPFLEMLEKLSLSPAEALYVGDSYKKDIVGGSKVGMRTLLIGKSGTSSDYPGADMVLTSWKSFARIILDQNMEQCQC